MVWFTDAVRGSISAFELVDTELCLIAGTLDILTVLLRRWTLVFQYFLIEPATSRSEHAAFSSSLGLGVARLTGGIVDGPTVAEGIAEREAGGLVWLLGVLDVISWNIDVSVLCEGEIAV